MYHVRLRPLLNIDAPELYRLVDANRDQLKKFWWEAGTQAPADSLNFINNATAEETSNKAFSRGIIADEALIGVAALHTVDWQKRSSQLGLWLDKAQHGHGYGTQTIHELAKLAFDEFDLQQISIDTRANNAGTRAIAEKNHFSLQSIDEKPLWNDALNDPVSTAHYALTAQEYHAHAA